jgi:hypothetical protein
MFFSKVTYLLPFSFAELVVLALPVIVAAIIVVSIKMTAGSNTHTIKFFSGLLSVITLFYSIFVFSFATGYRGSTLEQKLDLDRQAVTADELYETAAYLLGKATEYAEDVDFIYGGSSVMPFTLAEMNGKLNDAYDRLRVKYDFIPKLKSNLKFIVLSEPMTYTHISGVYTYYTGEANLNINFPDYTLPFTAAHELSHQRGIAREDEANFMAFLVCLESDDPYILYCAYLNVYEYVANALYAADTEKYIALLQTMDSYIRREIIAFDDFFEKYRETVVSNVSNTINDTFLKSQGQKAGRQSYGRVVDLAVAYFTSKAAEVVTENE